MDEDTKQYIVRKMRDTLDLMEVMDQQSHDLNAELKKGRKDKLVDYLSVRLQYARAGGEYLAYCGIMLKFVERDNEAYSLLLKEKRSMENKLGIFERGLGKVIVEAIEGK